MKEYIALVCPTKPGMTFCVHRPYIGNELTLEEFQKHVKPSNMKCPLWRVDHCKLSE